MKSKLLFILLLTLISQTLSSCPNDCSGKGSCIGNICICNSEWHGTDCSINEIHLNDNQIISGSVGTFGWKYYYIENDRNLETLEISLNETSTGDCDIYVRPITIPTRSAYYSRDVSSDKRILFKVDNINEGRWYIAIYGFTSCSYTLKAHITGGCPNDCSGHGTCINKECKCDSGWSGKDCSAGVKRINLNQQERGRVSAQEWKDYSVQITTGNSLIVIMNQLDTGGDCDLFLKYEEPSTLYKWDYMNATEFSITTIIVTYPNHGIWYIGVYGFKACSFSIEARVKLSCPSKCSNHGSCNNGSPYCTCESGYSGEACETKNAALLNGEEVQGFVSPNFWNYYTYISNSADNMIISINQEETGETDCDVYIKAGSKPTRFDFDFQNTSISQNFRLTIPDPGSAAWNIGIYGWTSCAYHLSVIDSSNCPNNCNYRGTCNNEGHCICSTNYIGEACEFELFQLRNNQLIGNNGRLSVIANDWKYFSISPSIGSTSLHVQIKELDTKGFIWMFGGKSFPTIRNFEQCDQNISSNIHRIRIDLNPSENQEEKFTYFIGVYGNPFLPLYTSASFEIVAWYPPS